MTDSLKLSLMAARLSCSNMANPKAFLIPKCQYIQEVPLISVPVAPQSTLHATVRIVHQYIEDMIIRFFEN